MSCRMMNTPLKGRRLLLLVFRFIDFHLFFVVVVFSSCPSDPHVFLLVDASISCTDTWSGDAFWLIKVYSHLLPDTHDIFYSSLPSVLCIMSNGVILMTSRCYLHCCFDYSGGMYFIICLSNMQLFPQKLISFINNKK